MEICFIFRNTLKESRKKHHVKVLSVFSTGELEPLFSKVEIALMALEDTLDARDLQARQNTRRKELATFEAQKKAEFEELSGAQNLVEKCDIFFFLPQTAGFPHLQPFLCEWLCLISERLQRDHLSKKRIAEANELVARQQKQRVFQQRFDNDVAAFKTGGQLRGTVSIRTL